jgi:serine protease
MPVKVLGDDGSGTIVDIAEGIYWAVDKGAHVINMSLGVNAASGKTSDGILDPALQYAFTQGVTVVAAAGNDSFG